MTCMARIHYEIDDNLHRRSKAAAAMQGITLKAFIEHALEEATKTADRDRKAPGAGRSSRA